MKGRSRFSNQWVLGAVWAAACLGAAYFAMSYDFIPGKLGARLTQWPADSGQGTPALLASHPHKTVVLAFLHPRCVCTRATVKQLLKIAQAHPTAELIVPVFTPADLKDPKAWEESEYVRSIRTALPQAKIVFDRDGIQALRFGALTSGTILVYDTQGEEIFRGGITKRRGGEEDNPGLRQFDRALGEGVSQKEPTPVFGCPLVATGTLNRRSPQDVGAR